VTTAVIPEVGPLRRLPLPSVSERTLDNGLRVLAARRAGVPRFEIRLVVPTARGGKPADSARVKVLAKTLLSGTTTRTALDLAEELQGLGASLDAVADEEDVVLTGGALSSSLTRYLALLADVLTDAQHPKDEVALERHTVAQELELARSQPQTIARDAMVRRLYGSHPYGNGLPAPDDAESVKASQLRRLHDDVVRPDGAILVIVGDLAPDRTVDLVAEHLGSPWKSGGKAGGLKPPKPILPPSPILIVDRPGAVQTNIRVIGPALGRDDPGYAAQAIANLVYGGYFTSRLVDNIREEKGYTYSPRSLVQQYRQSSHFITAAEVGTEVTAAALMEIRYELGRMISTDVEDAELTAAKRYLAGRSSMGIQTQSGLASSLSVLAVHGLPVSYLRELPAQAEALTTEEVRAAAQRFLALRRLHTVLVGDAARIRGELEAFDDVEVVPAAG
jgi:zinc protease